MNGARDRLIELIKQSDVLCWACPARLNGDIANRLADHLLEKGVDVPPVAIGEIVYEIRVKGLANRGMYEDHSVVTPARISNAHARGLKPYIREKIFKRTDKTRFGKTVFLTREEADEAIKTIEHYLSLKE